MDTPSLIELLRPLIDATDLLVERVEADPETGAVTLDGDVTIETEERAKIGLFGPHAETVYVVTFAVNIPQTWEEPADVDIVDVGTYTSPAEAVGAALGVLIQHRIADYQERLADEEMARACQEDPSLDLG